MNNNKSIVLTEVSNATNGHKRYILNSSELVNPQDFKCATNFMTTEELIQYVHNMSVTQYAFNKALKRCKSLGGKKYKSKTVKNHIVFLSVNIEQLTTDLQKLIQY